MVCMKVLPVNLSFLRPQVFANTPQYKDVLSENYQRPRPEMPSAYYLPVNFCAKDDKQVALINDLKSLKNLHCPYCGTKMLSADEMNDLQLEADKIKSVNNLFKFLNKYEDFINPRFSNIVAEVKHVGYANFDSTADEVLALCKKNMQQKSDDAYKFMLIDFDKLLQSGDLNEHDSAILSSCKDAVALIPENTPERVKIYKEFSKTMKNSVSQLQSPQKNKIYMRLNTAVRDSFFNEYLFEQKRGNETSLSKIFIKNLFGYSKSDTSIVTDKAPADTNNIMLTCKHCEVTGKSLSNKDLKKHFYYNHIYELCRAALAGDLHENRSYPIRLQNSVIKNFNNRFAPDNLQPDLRALLKETGLKIPRYVEFPLTDIPGICCASCGQKTITHEQKAKIYQEIQDSETMPDLLGIFHKYREVIKPKYVPLIQEFERNLSQHSVISESGMEKLLKVFTYKNLQDTLTENIKNVEDISEAYDLKPEEAAAVRRFISQANNLSLNLRPEKLFPLEKYHDILSELAGSVNHDIRREFWATCYRNIVNEYARQIVLIPPESVSYKGKSTLKIMAEYIFNHSLATVDHLDPKSKYNSKRQKNSRIGYPENKYENLVVMCKDCNTSKSSTGLGHWVQRHPEMISNMEKYIMQVKQLSKDKIIGKKFEFYPYEVAAQFSRLTNIDISTSGS